MMKKILKSFLNVSDRFRLRERMSKHAFAGRNTQQVVHDPNNGFFIIGRMYGGWGLLILETNFFAL